jgi:3,4-dihydroxy 2-butanone 4-phosphate synthase / GTP cyclohydrolase II
MQKIKDLLKEFTDGKIVVVFDDENRENEADLIVAIDKLTPEKVNFLITHGKGLLCASLSEDIVKKKGLPLMPTTKTDPQSTAFTISVDSKSVKTGISPFERYTTAKDLIDPSKNFSDFITPGHLFPLIARKGGLLERRGHTEASEALCRWTGLTEGALICEMINEEGRMYSPEQARSFADEYGLPFCTIDELVEYQNLVYPNVEKVASSKLNTEYGQFDITIYRELFKDKEHVFISMGDYKNGVVRIHSECFTGDVLSSIGCDCRSQLEQSLERISNEGKGSIAYLRQEGRGIGLGEKIKAYALQQNKGMDTVEANVDLGHKPDNREYHQAAWMLKDQGYTEVKLLTNNPHKAKSLEKHGFKVQMENIDVCVRPENYNYLFTKKEKMGHKLSLTGDKNDK